MSFILQISVTFVTIISFLGLLTVSDLSAAMDPRFELDPQEISGLKSTTKPQQAGSKRVSATPKTVSTPAKSGASSAKRKSYGTSAPRQIRRGGNSRTYVSGNAPEQSFKLESPLPALAGQEVIDRTQKLWKMMVPTKKEQQAPLSFRTPAFSLSLDPVRYPAFARMDGGRIILDQDGTIPLLVKSLIEDKDSSVKIVSEAPDGSKKFVSSLLEAAGFYSVEENFSLEFGTDPKVTVRADFKVEKNADSLINQDVVIINTNHASFPPSLGTFLKKEGFSLYEPFTTLKSLVPYQSRAIHAVSAKKHPEIVDSILSAFSVLPEKNRQVNVFAASDNGISLSVKAERYFVRNGQRFVVTTFDGDPVNYTLFRILEATGFKVIILGADDDFRKVSEKMLTRMRINGSYAQHSLLQEDASGYSLQMSGFKLFDAQLPGGDLFLTDRSMNRIVTDLLKESGFAITNR